MRINHLSNTWGLHLGVIFIVWFYKSEGRRDQENKCLSYTKELGEYQMNRKRRAEYKKHLREER